MMPTIILPILVLLASSSAVVADPTALPFAAPPCQVAHSSERGPIAESARKAAAGLALRVEGRSGSQTDPEPDSWMERHPVWTGVLVGAGVGAAHGALSCRNGCFPLGRGGAVTVTAGYGAGVGALLGWAIGAANRDAP